MVYEVAQAEFAQRKFKLELWFCWRLRTLALLGILLPRLALPRWILQRFGLKEARFPRKNTRNFFKNWSRRCSFGGRRRSFPGHGYGKSPFRGGAGFERLLFGDPLLPLGAAPSSGNTPLPAGVGSERFLSGDPLFPGGFAAPLGFTGGGGFFFNEPWESAFALACFSLMMLSSRALFSSVSSPKMLSMKALYSL